MPKSTKSAKITFRQFQDICLPPKILRRAADRRYLLFHMRFCSIRLSWLLSKWPSITPNMVTVFMIIWAPVASALILIPGVWGVIAFFLGYQLWGILDRADGELARFKQQFSPAGEYLDSVAHVFLNTFCILAIGLKFYQLTHQTIYIYIASTATIVTCIKHLLYKSSNYFFLEKGIPHENIISKNFPIRINREILMVALGLSMASSVLLAIFIYTGNTNQYIPFIFFGYYILLIAGAFPLSIYTVYRRLNKGA